MSEIDTLRAILEEDYWALSGVGDSADGFEVKAENDTQSTRWHLYTELVARAPSGKYYQWTLVSGLTEYQETDISDQDFSKIVEVKPVEVTRIKYVPVDN